MLQELVKHEKKEFSFYEKQSKMWKIVNTCTQN
jgi:hypothetical protein